MMWGKLEQILVSRSGKSCRERWFNHVDPRIKKGDWTAEEEWVLFILRDQQALKWNQISKHLMGRTDNSVKNYWNSKLQKKLSHMKKAYELHFNRKNKENII